MPPAAPPDPDGPQLFLSLQQKRPAAPVVAGRHWYPEGQPSLVLQDAFAPGGLAPLETQPARAARDSQ
jgi:hypothetical protein